ncbi:hypothetical protein LQ50_24665 [Halalkalibacter okhensis]|uniref:Tubby C-terminal domain-containing protein n=1 Tax=Halalkalibacter okhensis TaxID=333138 RepID=A0A0B0IE33_9BACI|nr:hypothetical protein [Halalkalibacter okhensis]KHF37901.1 hypothetical protein LQ50_24665 [Halalkalibacter okhensis]
MVQAIDAWSLRRKFHNTYTDKTQEKMVATEVNNIKLLNKKLEFETDGQTYLISKDSFDKRTTLSKGDEEIIWVEHDRALGPKTNYIKVLREDLDIKLALCILHAFEIGV